MPTFFFQQKNLCVLIQANYDHYNQFRISSHVILYIFIHEFYITEGFFVIIDINICHQKIFIRFNAEKLPNLLSSNHTYTLSKYYFKIF